MFSFSFVYSAPRRISSRRDALLFLPPSLSLSFEKQKDRDGGNALIRFIPSSHRLWSYFPEISLLGTSSPHFFIPLLTALFYLKSISLLTKPFRPTFNAIRNTFSHLWRIYSKVQSSFFFKRNVKQTNESNLITRLLRCTLLSLRFDADFVMLNFFLLYI